MFKAESEGERANGGGGSDGADEGEAADGYGRSDVRSGQVGGVGMAKV